jgi:hypothetical protein
VVGHEARQGVVAQVAQVFHRALAVGQVGRGQLHPAELQLQIAPLGDFQRVG